MAEEKIKNIYFFYGEDTYTLHQKIKFWKDQFEKKHGGDMNIENIEGKELEPKSFGTNLQALPFLAEKRLVIVKDFLGRAKADEQKIIADILKTEVPDFCILVFSEAKAPDKRTTLYKTLKKIAKVEEFTPLSPPQLVKWIIEQAQQKEGVIGQSEANFLGERVGPNLWQLSNEIDKLISATGKKNPITRILIEDLVPESLSSSIFKLTDSLATKNRKGSLKVFKTLIESGEDLMMIFYMLVRHFRILIQTHSLIAQGEHHSAVARKLKQHPYVAQTASSQSKNFTRDQLKKIYGNLLQIDKSFKTGRIKISVDDARELLLEIEQFIIETCK
jgi:DNA polymerase III subunit delta